MLQELERRRSQTRSEQRDAQHRKHRTQRDGHDDRHVARPVTSGGTKMPHATDPHITDTSRRSPSGVMLRASQGRPRYAGRPQVVGLSTCRSHVDCFHGKEIKTEF
jgi:hypothetical protein